MAKTIIRRYKRMTEEEIKALGHLTPEERMKQGISPLVDEYGEDPHWKAIDEIVEGVEENVEGPVGYQKVTLI